ncbi:AmmeMemoRadiSam system protein B [Fervidicoccus fontis]|uniref:MEMO1 family protein ENO39_01155 n=1 Tax=Fervidicoccus fontis TaxID=683846 RepID=A0A7C2ZN41_9CREN|nr:AmmeMemoRadiSam system protein B [Fervidicoccus fontis]HEW63656.1 AmmeMemoRadiSam system protein B [Fervidicoccus fontis]
MSGDLVRDPVVAGEFYELRKEKLLEQIRWAFLHSIGPGKEAIFSNSITKNNFGYIAPHAGYIYSGPVAAHTYYNISLEKKPDTFIIIGPNHTGLGAQVSLAPWKQWRTPLGLINVDIELRDYLITKSKVLVPDYNAHLYEHSIEVQLPFLQYIFQKDFQILPIVLMRQTPKVVEKIAEELLDATEHLGRDFTIIASSDMSHYEPYDVAKRKDLKAFEMIKKRDINLFYNYLETENVSMCGPGGVMILMTISKMKNGREPEILKYATSGDLTGDKDAVVGYLSAKFPI